jgi:hypothetical protein
VNPFYPAANFQHIDGEAKRSKDNTGMNQQAETVKAMVSSTFADDNDLSSTNSEHSASTRSRTIGLGDDREESFRLHHYNYNPKMVTFSTIEVREYPIIPGDNPASLSGVPLTIDWIPVETASCNVDEYEANKPPPRQMFELRMPSSYRKDLLQTLGFPRSELVASVRTVNIFRNQRRRTVETMQFCKAEEALEKVKRAALNVTLWRSKKAQERKFLQKFAKQMHSFHDEPLLKDCCGKKNTTTDCCLHSSIKTDITCEEDDEPLPPPFRHKDSIRVR